MNFLKAQSAWKGFENSSTPVVPAPARKIRQDGPEDQQDDSRHGVCSGEWLDDIMDEGSERRDDEYHDDDFDNGAEIFGSWE